MVKNHGLRQTEFLKPRYWITWIGIGLFRGLCVLPLKGRWFVGALLGRIACLAARRRRHIVRTNLRLCFPQLGQNAIENLVRRVFESSGISLLETALVWFTDPARYRNIVDIEGLEHLQQAVAEQRGVLLLGMHLSTLDFCGAVLATEQPFDVMYRKNKNRLLEAVMTRGRARNFASAIERDNVRQVIRRLRQGAIVWYGPDQDYGRKHSVFAPFFGRPAATITATSRIAAMTGSPVIVFSHYRDLATGRYRIRLSPALEAFPGDSAQADCARINLLIEDAVRQAPEQYWWLHRRFKTTPDGGARPYDL